MQPPTLGVSREWRQGGVALVRARLRMSFRRGRALVTAGALAAMWTLAEESRAQETPSVASDLNEETAGDPTIVLMLEPGRPESSRLVQAIQSHLVGLPVRVEVEALPRGEILQWFESGHRRAKERKALGLFAIETGRRDLWRLYFLDVDGAPTLIRRLRPSPEHAPLDDAGVAVRLLVEALLDVRPLGLTEPALDAAAAVRSSRPDMRPSQQRRSPAHQQAHGKASKPAAPQPAGSATPSSSSTSSARATKTAPAREPGALAVFVGAVGTTWLVDQAWQLGARGGAELHWKTAWSVALDYTWYPTVSLELAETAIAWTRHPVASQLAYRPGSGLSPRFWLGAWADPVTRTTLDTTAAFRSTASVTTWSWGPAAGIGLATPTSWSFSALLDLGVEVAVARVEYVVRNDTNQGLTATRSVRPALGLRLGWRP